MPREPVFNIVVVPQIGPNDTEAILVEWHVKDGDEVQKSDIIISLETAKAVTDIESEYTGNIVTLHEEGETLVIGETLAFIGNDLKKLTGCFCYQLTLDVMQLICGLRRLSQSRFCNP